MTEESEEALVLTPMPAICLLLLNLETQMGRSLTENEVLEVRNNATCVNLPESVANAMEESRDYRDLILDDIWHDWQGFKEWFNS